MGTLKKFVSNKARPEGSIAEAYIDYECITFMSMYLEDSREERNYTGASRLGISDIAIFKKNWRVISASTYGWYDPVDFEKSALHSVKYL